MDSKLGGSVFSLYIASHHNWTTVTGTSSNETHYLLILLNLWIFWRYFLFNETHNGTPAPEHLPIFWRNVNKNQQGDKYYLFFHNTILVQRTILDRSFMGVGCSQTQLRRSARASNAFHLTISRQETPNLYGDIISTTASDIIGDTVVTPGGGFDTVLQSKVIGNGMGGLPSFESGFSKGQVVLDFENSAVKMPSAERDIRNSAMFNDGSWLGLNAMTGSYRDDSYNYFFRQSGRVETQGECSSTVFGVKEGYIYGGPSFWEAMRTTNASNIGFHDEDISPFHLSGRKWRHSERQQASRRFRIRQRRSQGVTSWYIDW